jgi:hypothetical protein
VSDLDPEIQLFQVAQADQLDIQIILEVALVLGSLDELLELSPESEDVFVSSGSTDAEVVLLLHGLTARYVLDPEGVCDVVRDLHGFVRVDAAEDRVHERDSLNNERYVFDIDAVTDIVGVLDEEEDDAGEELRHRATNSKSKTSESRPKLCCAARESSTEEGRVDQSNSDQHDEAKDIVENSNGVADVLHAGGSVLAVLSKANN